MTGVSQEVGLHTGCHLSVLKCAPPCGPYPQETSAVLQSVDFITDTGEKKTVHKSMGELTCGYRQSPFQFMGSLVVISAVRFQLRSCVGARKRQIDYMDGWAHRDMERVSSVGQWVGNNWFYLYFYVCFVVCMCSFIHCLHTHGVCICHK